MQYLLLFLLLGIVTIVFFFLLSGFSFLENPLSYFFGLFQLYGLLKCLLSLAVCSYLSGADWSFVSVEVEPVDWGHHCRWSGWSVSLGNHRRQCLWFLGCSASSEKTFQSLIWSYMPGCQPISEGRQVSVVINVNFELIALMSGW